MSTDKKYTYFYLIVSIILLIVIVVYLQSDHYKQFKSFIIITTSNTR